MKKPPKALDCPVCKQSKFKIERIRNRNVNTCLNCKSEFYFTRPNNKKAGKFTNKKINKWQ